MTRADKKPKVEILTNREASYMIKPWSCNHYPTYSEIEAYIPITGDFEVIADIHATKGVDPEIVAGLIIRAVNNYEKNKDLIDQMASAIELCLQCEGCLTWEAEHEAQAVLKKIG